MWEVKVGIVAAEGLIFSMVALGVFVSFHWTRFPDLTPDGTFILGGAVAGAFSEVVPSPLLILFIAAVGGVTFGAITAILNRLLRIPAVVAGMLVASALYSISWLLMGAPTRLVPRARTIAGSLDLEPALWALVAFLSVLVAATVAGLALCGDSSDGLKIRSVRENPRLEAEVGLSDNKATLVGLGVGNGLVALAGALLTQRSFTADIQMGVGITIVGLAGLMLGGMLVRDNSRTYVLLLAIVLGSLLYKALVFLALELGLPAESFRLMTAVILGGGYLLVHRESMDFLRSLRWS